MKRHAQEISATGQVDFYFSNGEKTTSFKRPFRILFIGLLLVSAITRAQEMTLDWVPRQDLNILLPSSMRIFEANGKLVDDKPIRAMYAEIKLTDENLNLRAVGSNTRRETTVKTAKREKALFAVNGGYFAAHHSVSLIIQDGKVIAPGSDLEQPKGAFGLVKGVPEIVWSGAKGPHEILQFSSLDTSRQGKPWNPEQAVGGGPVLIKNGKIKVSSDAEDFGKSHQLRHPRTAMGYKNDSTLLVMVVEGRQTASVGVTLEELAEMMYDRGAQEALNLDGGGSSTMVAANEVVNVPVNITGGNRNDLRKNAGALVIAQKKPSNDNPIHLIDTESPLYSEKGIWDTSNQSNFYKNSASRSAQINSYNKACYRLRNIPKKKYQLAVWNPVSPEKEKRNKIRYIIHQNKKTDTVLFDQYKPENFGKWRVLGDYYLTSDDYVEVTGMKGDSFYTDAMRLVATDKSPELPERGDLRIAVISDLNSGLGAIDYQWQVDSIIQRLPRIWKPDLVLSGGDMVAGMGVSDTTRLRKMWEAFKKHITSPLLKAEIPFAFTLGNHDGNRGHPIERKFTTQFWKNNFNQTQLHFIDKTHFPHYYSFVKDSVFFASWEASSPKISKKNISWLKNQLEQPEAKNAEFRFVMGHMPLYGVAKDRDAKGDVLDQSEELRSLLEKYKVHTYISGHQHAYYPGKRGELELLNAGAAGSGPRSLVGESAAPINTVTIVDLFYDDQKTTYTTYNIKEKEDDQMNIITNQTLPSSIFGDSGYVIRRDIVDSVHKASGTLSPFNTRAAHLVAGEGEVKASIHKKKLGIEGWFRMDENSKFFIENDSVQLCLGKNASRGKPLTQLKITEKRTNKIHFKGALKADFNFKELLAVGALYVKVTTKEGALRAQLYPSHNTPPSAVEISSHSAKNIYGLRDVEALYTIEWNAATDADGDHVSYVYQLAKDSLFSEILLEKNTGRATKLKLKESDFFQLLEEISFGEQETFYQRVITSDGSHFTCAAPSKFQLLKTDEAASGPIEVASPNYVLQKKIASSAQGYGATWDNKDKLWLADYHKGLIVLDQNFQPVNFSPLKKVKLNGSSYELNPVTGISTDQDGNILAAINNRLIKINADTGKAIALWKAPKGKRAITTPRAAQNGEIYAMSLFPDDPNYVLKQQSDTFELKRTLTLDGRILSRSFAMSPDGGVLYFPDPGSPQIQVFTKENDEDYKEDKTITRINGGGSAIQFLGEHSLYTASRSNGISPSSFHYINNKTQQTWNLKLPELKGAEPRGLGVSKDQKTLIFCSWDKGGGYYLYRLNDED